MARLLDKRLVFVTGKGGVGKSAVAAALGVAAARAGRRTIVAEVARRGDAARALGDTGAPGRHEERRLDDRLWATSVDPQAALEEYLVDQLPVRALAEALGGSRAFALFAAATPGMAELLTVGKLWELAQPRRRVLGAGGYDLVIVDAPASGHGVALLRTPATFASVARVGPIARQARIIAGTLADPDLCGLVAVTRPEEIPVTETIDLQRELREQMGLEFDLLVANGVAPGRLSARDAETVQRTRDAGRLSADATAALDAALAEHAEAVAERRHLARLRRACALPVVRLPQIATPGPLGPPEAGRLADELETALA